MAENVSTLLSQLHSRVQFLSFSSSLHRFHLISKQIVRASHMLYEEDDGKRVPAALSGILYTVLRLPGFHAISESVCLASSI